MQSGSPHTATVIAAVMVVAGFVVIVLSWRGAAATLFIPTQVAFSLSGGATGLALIGAGLAIINVQYTRMVTARRSHSLRVLLEGTVAALAALSERGSPVRHGVSGPVAAPDARHNDDLYRPPSLLAGRSVVHRPDCGRLRPSTTRAKPLTWPEARKRGLKACQICKPA